MKHLRETFTDAEWLELKEAKTQSEMNWHDLLLQAIPEYVAEYCHKPVSKEDALRITKDLVEEAQF